MEEIQSLQQVVLKSGTALCKSMKLEYSLTLYSKINQRLNIRYDTRKFLKKNIDKIFSGINLSNISYICLSRQKK